MNSEELRRVEEWQTLVRDGRVAIIGPAARFYNACRAKGVTGGGVDRLICAVALRLGLPIFTTDPDFSDYAKHVPVKLHKVTAFLELGKEH